MSATRNQSSLPSAPSKKQPAAIRTASASKLLPLLLLLLTLPAAVQAQFTFTTNNGAITITGYFGPGGDVIIPSNINNMPVTSIGNNAFDLCEATSVTMPAGITNIGRMAFNYCV